MSLDNVRVAVVHDWLPLYGGAERVLEQILLRLPNADLFTLVDLLKGDTRRHILHKKPKTSFFDRWEFTRKRYRSFLPLMPLAVEQFDLSEYQLVISSSSAVAKGVITGPDQLHICYCHSPIRYAWDLQHQYLRESGLESGLLGWLARWFLHRIRLWDVRTANGVDHFISNSDFIRRRIWKVYRREAEVIYPPVDITSFQCQAAKENYYVTASRMVPYKRIDLIVEAFKKMPEHKLIVIGDGPEFSKVRSKAGPNVELLGHVSYESLHQHLRNAKGFIFAAEEDFGITPVEAQACGTPVIAYGRGGALETVRGVFSDAPAQDGMTGLFFRQQTPDSIAAAVQRFEQLRPQIRAEDCRNNAERFSTQNFSESFENFVNCAWAKFS